MPHNHPILIVEDSDEDYYATERTLRKYVAFPLDRCSKGSDVMEYMTREAMQHGAKPPSLILLDLNLPGKRDGRYVLAELKRDPRYRGIPVIVMTTSSNPDDVRKCFDLGAAGYIVKPVNLDRFVETIECLVQYWYETITLPMKAGNFR